MLKYKKSPHHHKKKRQHKYRWCMEIIEHNTIQCQTKKTPQNGMLWFGFGRLTLPSTIIQLYHGSQFYWWRKPEYPEKTTDLPQGIHWENVKIKKYIILGVVPFGPFLSWKKLYEPTQICWKNVDKKYYKKSEENENYQFQPFIRAKDHCTKISEG